MDTTEPRAVFLSYASQDVDAARRIAEALRAFGIDVWFDQHELRGGEAWDAKIRKQIHDCTLFLPVISTETQRRGEGYFRREWKLAADRTQDLAQGVPFIVPIVIDDVPENAAMVPEQFVQVQWVRLPQALPSPDFVQQVKRLLETPRSPAIAATRLAPPARGSAATSATPSRRILALASVTAFAVVVATGVALWSWRKPPAPAGSGKSIAVLPFANIGSDAANTAFCDGLHADVITALWKIRNLKVISRGSVLEYKDQNRNLREIAKELGVTHLLEGSVRRAGDQLRVNAQLIDGRTDQQISAETYAYDKTVRDMFAIQAEIAGQVARALTASLSPEDKQAISRPPTQNQEAYDLYLKATGAGVVSAEREKLLVRAVELDPNFLAAWCRLTRVRSMMLYNYMEEPEERPARLAAARHAMERANALQPEAPEVAVARGNYFYRAEKNFDRALTEFTTAGRRFPNDSEIDTALGQILRALGRFREAAVFLEKALERDPRNRSSNSTALNSLPWVYRCLRDGRSADQAYARVLETRPENSFLWGLDRAYSAFYLLNDDMAVERFLDSTPADADKNGQLSRARFEWLLQTRRFEDARQLLEQHEAKMYADDLGRFVARGRLYWLNHQPAELRVLAEAHVPEIMPGETDKMPERIRRLKWIAIAQAALGHTEQAFALVREVEALKTQERWDGDWMRSMFDWRLDVYLVLGRNEEALDVIEKLLATPSQLTVRHLQTQSYYDQLRSLPRFQKLIARPKS